MVSQPVFLDVRNECLRYGDMLLCQTAVSQQRLLEISLYDKLQSLFSKRYALLLARAPPGSPGELAPPGGGGGVIFTPLLSPEPRVAEGRARRRSKGLAKAILIST